MDKKISNIKERILEISDYKGIGKEKFIENFGMTYGNFKGKQKLTSLNSDFLDKILSEIPEINAEWLLTGKGSMLKEEQGSNLPVATRAEEQEGIPLIPTDAMAGIANGEISILELDCERYVIPMFRGADYLISVKGSSMIPKYSSGDVVACKRVPMQDIFFQWNKVYVLDTNQGAIIKRVAKSEQEDHIKIVSENPKYEPFDLHLSQIYAISIVIGVVRLE
ncbi:S24 family peptidase [Bergeyella cardium]|uniref:Peptidase S24/S26A/S26B/S26C domain-containing protein n=1 Tax=Bergeyella cardium TaxID=1585976 RepID=A0A6P1QUN1_9FLAO|nr:helix-turn-helix transcriptional regulator [Bergeyella cardium]QHN64877.1 hypothetical protein DBX24_02690 [Bergeyella cardium]WHE34186.1 helix-turn-helix transcriptional regulator [Bergeyella cardium]WHF60837.1 helix-turn-helix transcriptional regulator [Bergeyella cardium]